MLNAKQTLLTYAPWSYSMAGLAKDCSYAFNKKYVEKVKGDKPEDSATSTGTIAHRILELGLLGTAVDAAYTQALVEYPQITFEQQSQLECFRDAIESFLRDVDTLDRKIGIVYRDVEAELCITPDFTAASYNEGSDRLLRGKVDLHLVLKNGQALVIDHKSGAARAIKYHQQQLDAYLVFITAKQPDVLSARAGIHYVGTSPDRRGKRTVWGPGYSRHAVQSMVRERVWSWLLSVAANLNEIKPNKCWRCSRFCEYQLQCPLFNGQF